MRKIYTLILLVFTIGFTSCDRDENRIPAPLVGNWQKVVFNEYLELNYLTTYTFNANGTYVHNGKLREVDSNVDLGFDFQESGSYRVENDQIIFAVTKVLHKPFFGDQEFYSLEELAEGESQQNTEYPKNYEIRAGGQELFFPGGLEHGDIIVPDRSFTRVE